MPEPDRPHPMEGADELGHVLELTKTWERLRVTFTHPADPATIAGAAMLVAYTMRARRLARSMLVLVAADLAHEASIVLRTLVDLWITAMWLSQGPLGERGARLEYYDVCERLKAHRQVTAHAPAGVMSPDAVAVFTARKAELEEQYGSDVNLPPLEQRALAINSPLAYNLVFRVESALGTHSTLAALDQYAEAIDGGFAVYGSPPQVAPARLRAAARMLLELAYRTGIACPELADPAIAAAAQEIRRGPGDDAPGADTEPENPERSD